MLAFTSHVQPFRETIVNRSTDAHDKYFSPSAKVHDTSVEARMLATNLSQSSGKLRSFTRRPAAKKRFSSHEGTPSFSCKIAFSRILSTRSFAEFVFVIFPRGLALARSDPLCRVTCRCRCRCHCRCRFCF